MSTDAATPAPDSADAADTARVVRERLDTYRRDLYRGRGSGISEEEWLRNTSLRGSVAGIPTAASRENLHLRTLRIRGELREHDAEATWAAAQFPPDAAGSGRCRRR